MVLFSQPFYPVLVLIESLDITIELEDERPNSELQLKIFTDVERKYAIRNSKDKIIRRVSNDRM